MKNLDNNLEERLNQALETGTDKALLRANITDYLKHVVQLAQAGSIDREAACYHIVGAASIEQLESEPIFDEIVTESGELELPAAHVSGNVEDRWEHLEQLITSLP